MAVKIALAAAVAGLKSAAGEMFTASSLSPYPGYAGDLQITAHMLTLEEEGSGADAAQLISYSLAGTDPRCSSGADLTGVANACGIHIHAGKNCADAGGHLWNEALLGPQDPWAHVTYRTVDGHAVGDRVQVITGLTDADVRGRTFVVHDATGARAACSVIQDLHEDLHSTSALQTAAGASVGAFTVYPGYAGNLHVGGTVSMVESGSPGIGAIAAQMLTYSLHGTDPACTATADLTGVANACGVHIHAGTDCANAGGHLWNEALLGPQDPWQPVRYVTAAGAAEGADVQVITGLTMADVVGHTFVVHDVTGARVACGVIGPAPRAGATESAQTGNLRGAAKAAAGGA